MRVRKEEELVRYEEPEMIVISFGNENIVTNSIDNKPGGDPDIDW